MLSVLRNHIKMNISSMQFTVCACKMLNQDGPLVLGVQLSGFFFFCLLGILASGRQLAASCALLA